MVTTLLQLQVSLPDDREAPLNGVRKSADLTFKHLERKFMCYGLHPALVNIMANSLKTLMLHQLCQ